MAEFSSILFSYFLEAKTGKVRYALKSGVIEGGTYTLPQTGAYDLEFDIAPMFYSMAFYSHSSAYDIVPSKAHEQAYRKHFDLRRSYGLPEEKSGH